MKNITHKYVDQALENFTGDLSKKLNPYNKKGGNLDIHTLIGKLPRPKAGFTPGNYKYMGPYNPLNEQLEYKKNIGMVTKWHVKPYNKVDEIAAHHDHQMVKSLDEIPYGEMPKWGQTGRFLINAKQKLGLGVKPKNLKQC